MADLKTRRIEAERRYLAAMKEANPGRLDIAGWYRGEVRIRLLDTPAYLPGGGTGSVHEVRLVFAEYYPAVPLEGFLAAAVVHPNVHPENGFMCLWEKHAAGDTVVEALLQVQRVITWRLRNDNPEHVMQPGLALREPLPYTPLSAPPGYWESRAPGRPAGARKRLS